MKPILIAVALAGSLYLSMPARAATIIDFEAQGATAPNAFSGHTNSPLVIGIATFTGGQLLNHELGFTDATVVYATTNNIAGPYTDPLTIAFSQPVSGFSIVVTNEIPDTYIVGDNKGGSTSLFVNANTSQTFTLADSGIGSVTIASSATVLWDFAIDNVTFSPVTTAPEPATYLPIASALLGALLIARGRRRTIS